MRAEYDYSGGVRGKHYRAMQKGFTIIIHNEEGTTTVKEMKPKGTVLLEPDVQKPFSDSKSVNAALRALIPVKRTAPAKETRSPYLIRKAGNH